MQPPPPGGTDHDSDALGRGGIPEIPVLLDLAPETSSSESDMRTDGQRPACPPSQRWRAPPLPCPHVTPLVAPHPAPGASLFDPSASESRAGAPLPRQPPACPAAGRSRERTPQIRAHSPPPPSTQACVPPNAKACEAPAPPRRHVTLSPRQPGIVLGSRRRQEPLTPNFHPGMLSTPGRVVPLPARPPTKPRSAGCSGRGFALPTFKSPSAAARPFSASSQAGGRSSSPAEPGGVFRGARRCGVPGGSHTPQPPGTPPSHRPAATQPRRRQKRDLFAFLFTPDPASPPFFSFGCAFPTAVGACPGNAKLFLLAGTGLLKNSHRS